MKTKRSDDYPFPFRKKCGEVVWVDFATMMDASLDELTLEDGTVARRARDLEDLATEKADRIELRTECVSDNLGFVKTALPGRLAHLKQVGIKGVEFREDKDVPGFMQVVCDSQATKLKYAAEFGLSDKNSKNGGGAAIGAHEIEQAQELVRRNHAGDDSLLIASDSDA